MAKICPQRERRVGKSKAEDRPETTRKPLSLFARSLRQNSLHHQTDLTPVECPEAMSNPAPANPKVTEENTVYFHLYLVQLHLLFGSACGKKKKKPPANAGDIRDVGLIPGSGRSPGEGNAKPLQYSCLENPMDRGARRATVHRVAKIQTR